MPRRSPSPPRGLSLIEVMIAMGVLAVGLLAMWRLHLVGLTSNAAARRQTIATALARELVSGLERLPYRDAHLDAPAPGPTAPALFGNLVDASGAIATGAHEWDDTAPVPGVRLASEMREAGEGSGYERRWTVWAYLSPSAPAGATTAGVKIVAVSVVWWDPPFARPREVVLYTQVANPTSMISGLGANP